MDLSSDFKQEKRHYVANLAPVKEEGEREIGLHIVRVGKLNLKDDD